MIPLSTMWTRPSVSEWGCAFSQVTVPCVAHIVWPCRWLAQRGRRAAGSAGSLAGASPSASPSEARFPTAREPTDAYLLKSNARGVIATVLEALQARKQDLLTRPTADIPDDPAHGG